MLCMYACTCMCKMVVQNGGTCPTRGSSFSSSYGDTCTNVHYCVVVHVLTHVHVIITESVLIILEVYV